MLVGAGPEESSIRQYVTKLSLQDRVEFISPQSREKLAKWYSSFDVLVLPSHTDYFWKEQYGRVLVEAMACGTPVAGSQSGAIPIVIGNEERCFPEGNIAAMRTIIQTLTHQSGDEQEQKSLIKRAQLGAIEHLVNAFIDLHLQLSGGKER